MLNFSVYITPITLREETVRRGPSIFLDKSEIGRDFISRKIEGPLLAGYTAIKSSILGLVEGWEVGIIRRYYCWHVC